FVGHHEGLAGKAVFEAVHAAAGFAFGSARTCGELRVGAIGFELCGCHLLVLLPQRVKQTQLHQNVAIRCNCLISGGRFSGFARDSGTTVCRRRLLDVQSRPMSQTPPTLRSVLKSQYHASLAMLREAIERCPSEEWLSTNHKNAFWQVSYHTLFFAHLY